MSLSKYELSVLEIIRDEVDNFLKSENFKRNPEKSNIPKILVQLLPRITAGKSFAVNINSTSSEPFIMAMYPDINELDKAAKSLISILDDSKADNNTYLKTWMGIHNWILEIDVRLLLKDCPLCVRTGREFVAILCHEIGHVMLEDPFMLVTNYRRQVAMMDKFNKLASCKSLYVRKFMLPMFINTLSFRVHSKGIMKLHKEIAMDGYVPEEYRGDLLSYIEDCILITPESYHLITHTEDYDNDQKISIKFSRDALTMMRNRVDSLKHHLTSQYRSTSGSEYHKKLIDYIAKSTCAYDPEKEMSNMVMENRLMKQFDKEMAVCEHAANAVLESMTITDRDLTILEVQCEQVKTTEDKIYLIHTIYDYIEAIQKEDTTKLKKIKDPKVKEFIGNDDRLKRLNRCREVIMSKDTSDVGDRYGVFVRYPEGYEG